jgi:hypothetical protein
MDERLDGVAGTVARIAVRVQPVRGWSGRDKVVEVEGMEPESVRRALSISAAPVRR